MTIPPILCDIATASSLAAAGVVIAQTGQASVSYDALTQFGLLGIVLGWLMWRNDRNMDRLTKEVQRLTKAVLLTDAETSYERKRRKDEMLKDMEDNDS